jgi:hypothetical protein
MSGICARTPPVAGLVTVNERPSATPHHALSIHPLFRNKTLDPEAGSFQSGCNF